MIKTRNLIYVVLPILLLATLTLGAIVLSGNNNTANAQTKTGVEQTQVFLHRNRHINRIPCSVIGEQVHCHVVVRADYKSVVYVKNHDKSGGDCHTYHKIANVVNVHRDGDTTKPIISRQIWYQNGQSATYVPDPDGDGVVDNPYNGTFAEVYFGLSSKHHHQDEKMRRWICVPFGKKRRVANKFTGDISGIQFSKGWELERKLESPNLHFDIVAYHKDGQALAVEQYPQKQSNGTYAFERVALPKDAGKICALAFPNAKDSMKDMPQKFCIDGLSSPAPVVYHCYVGITTNPSNIIPHSSNITIKADSTKKLLENKRYVEAYRKSKEWVTGANQEQPELLGCDYGENRNYVAGNVWTIYKYLYSNN